jgi:hypothetical protein
MTPKSVGLARFDAEAIVRELNGKQPSNDCNRASAFQLPIGGSLFYSLTRLKADWRKLRR